MVQRELKAMGLGMDQHYHFPQQVQIQLCTLLCKTPLAVAKGRGGMTKAIL